MLSACSEDLLEIQQKSASNTATFYKTDADAESALTAMYATYIEQITAATGDEGIYNPFISGINYSADDVLAAGENKEDHGDMRIFNEKRYDASSHLIEAAYNRLYKAIYSANLVIEYFGQNADSDTKKTAIAQARIMRAWAHMQAAILFQKPPKIDHLLNSSEDIPVNVESQKSLLEWCVKECEEAITDAPERKTAADKEGCWIATKGFAQFVAGKAALFAGDYSKVIKVMKPLVESDKYALVPGEQFRDLFHVQGDGCPEKIFEFNYTGDKTLPGMGGGWEYGLGRGRWMLSNSMNWRSGWLAGKCKLQGIDGWGGVAINPDFAHKMLANDGDSYRRKATFLTSDEFMYDGELCPWASDATCETREQKEIDLERGVNHLGAFSRGDVMEVKMLLAPGDADPTVSAQANNTNVCLARLAEAYLIYAEACIQENDLAEAKKYINKIQERAGSATISDEVDMQVLMDEKQYELWFEGCRWNDLVRWGIAEKAFEAVLDNIPMQYDEFWETVKTEEVEDAKGNKTIRITNPDEVKPHNLRYVTTHPFKDAGITLKYEKKHEYWPIPQSVLDVNPKMQQIDGWK